MFCAIGLHSKFNRCVENEFYKVVKQKCHHCEWCLILEIEDKRNSLKVAKYHA